MYDDVIRCTGWSQKNGIFAVDAGVFFCCFCTVVYACCFNLTLVLLSLLLMQKNGKFAVMTEEYESVNVPGMYVPAFEYKIHRF